MRIVSPAKINLSLNVGPRMPDGFHWVETVMAKINMVDTLTIEFNNRAAWTLSVPGYANLESSHNLILQACRWFADKTHSRLGGHIVLDKKIPMGAGLGGGSSNAGVMLRALNRYAGSPLHQNELIAGARLLGADVSFFVLDHTWAWMDGRGDQLVTGGKTPALWLVVVCPGIHCDTAQMYKRLSRPLTCEKLNGKTLQSLTQPKSWHDFQIIQDFGNDFEQTITEPWLASTLQSLTAQGAMHAQLSGSGSAMFGLFNEQVQAQKTAAVLGPNAHALTLWV